MKPIGPPDSHHYNAACGWLELGNRPEAWGELALIAAENQPHPLVLDLRWSLCAADKQWDAAFGVAQQIMAARPDDPDGWLHCAYALRRKSGGGLDQAWYFLLPVADKFPTESVIAFNLACYACQLQQLDDARIWFKRACQVGEKSVLMVMALADDDLKPLWPEIRGD